MFVLPDFSLDGNVVLCRFFQGAEISQGDTVQIEQRRLRSGYVPVFGDFTIVLIFTGRQKNGLPYIIVNEYIQDKLAWR